MFLPPTATSGPIFDQMDSSPIYLRVIQLVNCPLHVTVGRKLHNAGIQQVRYHGHDGKTLENLPLRKAHRKVVIFIAKHGHLKRIFKKNL